MSQEELALKIGYKSRSSLNKIEKDGRNLTQSKIKAVADALQTTPAYIMGWSDEEENALLNKEKLSRETDIFEKVEKTYGKSVAETFRLCLSLNESDREKLIETVSMYLQLDTEDRAEIRGEIKYILKTGKYFKEKSKKESLDNKAM